MCSAAVLGALSHASAVANGNADDAALANDHATDTVPLFDARGATLDDPVRLFVCADAVAIDVVRDRATATVPTHQQINGFDAAFANGNGVVSAIGPALATDTPTTCRS